MIEILKTLIAVESISGNEDRITTLVNNLLENSEGSLERIGNTVVWKGPVASGKKTIALGAHLDTVPFTAEDWTITQPCSPLEKDGKIYGRGSCDMKAGAAIILDIILNNSFGQAYNLMAFFYDKEELGMPNGVTTLINLGYFENVDLCIIPEPTECTVNYGVFGNLNAKLTAHGIAAHSSKPKTGRNALYELLPVIEKIREYPVKTISGIQEAISVNKICGGNAINILPDKIEAFVDFRFDPGKTENEVQAFMTGFEMKYVKVEILGCFPGVMHNPEEDDNLKRLMRLAAKGSVVPFWSDIGQLGAAGVIAVNFGPGSIDQAHRIDEFVPIEDMNRIRKVIVDFLHPNQ